MQRIALLLLLALVLVPAATAALGLEDDDVTILRLDNGMTFLLLERHLSPTVAVLIRFDVGSANEHPGITGSSHLLEHMLFKGTSKIGITDPRKEKPLLAEIDEIVDEIEAERARLESEHGPRFWYDESPPPTSPALEKLEARLGELQDEARELVVKDELWATYLENGGVSLNASTSNDTTQYFVQLPANRLELWAFLESDRMGGVVLREFYSERDVVQEERRRGPETRPFSMLLEQLNATAFTAHPYHWPVVGWMSDIEGVRRDEVSEYFRAHYAPNNATAAIVGDFDTKETTRLIKKYFGRLRAQEEPPELRTLEPEQQGERRAEVVFDSNPYLAVGWHIPEQTHPDTPALSFLGSILSGGKTSRFYQTLVREKRLAQFVSAYASSAKYPDLFVAMGAPRHPHTVAELEAAIYEEIDRLLEEGPSEWEVQKLKNQTEANFVRRMDSNLGLAFQLTTYHMRYGDWRELMRDQERRKAVTAEDIVRVARKYLTRENRTVAWIARPEEAGAQGGEPLARLRHADPATLPYPLDELIRHAVWADDLEDAPGDDGEGEGGVR